MTFKEIHHHRSLSAQRTIPRQVHAGPESWGWGARQAQLDNRRKSSRHFCPLSPSCSYQLTLPQSQMGCEAKPTFPRVCMFAGRPGLAMQDGQRHHRVWLKSFQGLGHDSLASKSLAHLSSDSSPHPQMASFNCEWISV